MGETQSGVENSSGRVCLCCGAASASRSIPACWEHWDMLPEDLRSALVVSYGRVQLKLHAEKLLEAVKLWRLTGAWRPRTKTTAASAAGPRPETPVVTAAESDSEPRVISLAERRQKLARAAGGSVPAEDLEERAAILRP